MNKETKIFAVYIILQDGTCLFYKNFSPMPEAVLISAMISAMQSFIKEVSGSVAKKLSAGGFVFHIDVIGKLSIVFASSSDERPDVEMNQIRTRFIHKYGQHIDSFQGLTNLFDPFENDLIEILEVDLTSDRVEPKKQLNSFALLEIGPELQKIARELIMKKEANIKELHEKLGETEFIIKSRLEELFEMGYIGRYHDGNDFKFFI